VPALMVFRPESYKKIPYQALPRPSGIDTQ
jgi:hypothetical protein